MTPQLEKACAKCGEVKPLEDFYLRPGSRIGHRSHCKVCIRQYMDVNKEQRAETRRKWYEVNREQILEAQRKWTDANPTYRREYHQANKERSAEKNRKWYQANPGKNADHVNRHRAWKMQAEGSHSLAEWQMVLGLYGGRCAYCDVPADTRDHVIPLTKGGSDGIENIVPACRACNASKKNRFLWDWPNRPSKIRGAA